MKLRYLSFAFFIFVFVLQAQEGEKNQNSIGSIIQYYLLKDFHMNGGYENNWWFPYVSTKLSYKTEGFKIGYVNGKLKHRISFLPDWEFSYKTNFKSKIQDELVQIQNSSSNLEQGYNQLISIAKIGKEYIPKKAERYVIPFQLKYFKETFYIEVTPAVEKLRYAAYYPNDSDKYSVYNFPKDKKYSMFTKFQELNATFYIGNTSFFFMLLKGLFEGASKVTSDDLRDFSSNTEVRFGGFYMVYQKPFETEQIIGGGVNNAIINTIYNTKYKIYGITEEIHTKDNIFVWTNKLGFASVNLRKDATLEDFETPLYYYIGSKMELNIPISFSDGVGMSINASGEYGFLYGGTVSELQTASGGTENVLQAKSFINNDAILKVVGTFYVNL